MAENQKESVCLTEDIVDYRKCIYLTVSTIYSYLFDQRPCLEIHTTAFTEVDKRCFKTHYIHYSHLGFQPL